VGPADDDRFLAVPAEFASCIGRTGDSGRFFVHRMRRLQVVTTSFRVYPNEAVISIGGSGCPTIAYNITVE
jgi:hypothetical protein